jgi:hydrogenase small subunit
VIGRSTVNITGCPANPNWVVSAIVRLLTGQSLTLDAHGRPTEIYGTEVIHESCPRNPSNHPGKIEATSFGEDGQCLINLGCRGPATRARCEKNWNGLEGQATWCIGVNAPCHGCTEPTFPGPDSFYELYEG